MDALDTFITKITASAAKVGNTAANFGECVGLVAVWFDNEGEPHVWGNAKDLYANAGDGYTKGTNWPAPKGAATVLDASWGGGVGHTQISLGDGRVFEQNSPKGSLPKITNFGGKAPNGYIGWILPNNYKGNQDMPIPNADNYYNRYRKAMQYIRGRDLSRDEFDKNFVGNTDLQMLEALLDSPEADAQVDYANWGKTAKNDHWDQQIAGLVAERDKVNYPKINAATQGLGLPLDATAVQLGQAITDMKSHLDGNSTATAAILKDKTDQIAQLTDNLTKEIATNTDLKKQVAAVSGDTQLLNGFGKWLSAMIVRLGVKQ